MSEDTTLATYAPYTREAALEEQKSIDSQQEFMKLKPGRNRVRVLPGPVGSKSPFLKTFQHFVRDPGGSANSGQSFYCPSKMLHQPCAICEECGKLYERGDEASRKRANDMRAKERILMNVINRESQERGPVVLPVGTTIYKVLVDLVTDPDVGVEHMHPVEGHDILITKSGEGRDTEYTTKLGPKCPLGPPDKVAEWLAARKPLAVFVVIRSRDEMIAAIEGHASSPMKDVGGGSTAAARPTDDDIKY